MKPPEYKLTQGEIFNLALVKAGSARKLAALTGIARSTIYWLQSGKTKKLNSKSIAKLWSFIHG